MKKECLFKPLPDEAQWTDQKASLISDINNDGFEGMIFWAVINLEQNPKLASMQHLLLLYLRILVMVHLNILIIIFLDFV